MRGTKLSEHENSSLKFRRRALRDCSRLIADSRTMMHREYRSRGRAERPLELPDRFLRYIRLLEAVPWLMLASALRFRRGPATGVCNSFGLVLASLTAGSRMLPAARSHARVRQRLRAGLDTLE